MKITSKSINQKLKVGDVVSAQAFVDIKGINHLQITAYGIITGRINLSYAIPVNMSYTYTVQKVSINDKDPQIDYIQLICIETGHRFNWVHPNMVKKVNSKYKEIISYAKNRSS